MATTTNISTLKMKTSKINIKDFISTALIKFSESIGDMVVTVAVTGVTLMWMSITVHPVLVDIVSGYYITAMLLQVLIRIVHRFDDSYTVQELAEQILRMEEEQNKRWDDFIQNYIP